MTEESLRKILDINPDDENIRRCDYCGKPMREGYYLGGEYACSDELHRLFATETRRRWKRT